MKVLVVERSSDGGHAHYCALLVEHLLKQGVDVVVLSKNEGSEFSRIVRARYRTGSLWRAVREEMPDVVHLFPSLMPWEILPWLIVNRWHERRRTAYTVHNLELHEWKFLKSWAFRWTQRAVMRMVDVVAVQNEFTKRLLAATLPERKLHVVLHGNYCWFDGRKHTRVAARRKLRLTGDDFVVLFFGVVRPYKGVSFLVDAVRGLSGVRLYIVGKVWPDVAVDVARWKKELNVTVVDGYASNEDVEMYYKAADVSVCIQPCEHERPDTDLTRDAHAVDCVGCGQHAGDRGGRCAHRAAEGQHRIARGHPQAEGIAHAEEPPCHAGLSQGNSHLYVGTDRCGDESGL